ncbi:MAG: cAMP-binding protein [Spirochaetes bacterium GWF1_31_7]|nr:MAG: cAMP-binding protein [Spirochaetes bacterium GWE1_32_154]OHD48987.1 MAG: cAMP-binding protein [Spirochaetes bacterium GWE2_31_10]OHD49573.1 MAG: cAMP-binding protein [Spirochaetes bacterium GWF1_31_7]OHD80480.1 MAG: cAMP-binding protein [Spirochaetes bacterium RIFOXYB1_FULL_32_8]HBD95917.1 cAMP-binding protein [Spirochaetia bacterium]
MSNELQLEVVKFNKGAYITIEGKSSNGLFYIIRTGNVTLSKDVSDNQAEALNPGDFFGVVSAMSGHNYIETTIALTDVSLIVVTKNQFPLLIQKNNPIAMKIILSFSRKLRELDKSITELSLKSVSIPFEDTVNLYSLGEFYLNAKQYNQAFYAFYRFIQYCPDNDLVANAKQYLQQIKPQAKAVFLEPKPEEFKRVYPDNTIICCEHEPGNELYILQKGKVKITKMIDNKEVLLAVLKEGDIFGEMSLLENKPRSASAIAYEETMLMAVNKENFKNMISTQPQLVTKLISLLADRTWVVYRQLSNLKLSSKIGRFYDMLLIQLEKNKLDINPKNPYTFEFGTKELINMVGLTNDEGSLIIQEIFQNRKFQLKDNKIYVAEIDEIRKQVEYYKKMEMLKEKRKSAHNNF